jgi:hypothetical protein
MKKSMIMLSAVAAMAMSSTAVVAQEHGEAPSVDEPALSYLGANLYSGAEFDGSDVSRFSFEFQNAGNIAYFTGSYNRYSGDGQLDAGLNETRIGVGAHHQYGQGTLIFGDVNYVRHDYSVHNNAGFAPLAEGDYDDNGTLVRAGIKHRYAPGLEVGAMITRLAGLGDVEHSYQFEVRHYATERLSLGVMYEGELGGAGKVNGFNYKPNQWVLSARYHF